jgi:hypothetical protein
MKTNISRANASLAPVLLVLLAGCGTKWSQNDNVEGTLKMDGVPVANVKVQFVPDDPAVQAPASSAQTDENGHFRLTCENGRPGAVIGKHNVVIFKGRAEPGDGQTISTAVIPQAYTIAAKTPLQTEVTASEHNYDLKMSRNAMPRK